MRNFRYCIAIVCLPLLSACGGNDSDDEAVVTKSFEDFVAEVDESVEEGAVNCGIVEVGEPEVTTNTCVADSFVNEKSFFAVYQLQGIDSAVGAAITGDGEGNVMKWRYDSNPSGGIPASSSLIESSICINASLTGSVDGGFNDIFSCD